MVWLDSDAFVRDVTLDLPSLLRRYGGEPSTSRGARAADTTDAYFGWDAPYSLGPNAGFAVLRGEGGTGGGTLLDETCQHCWTCQHCPNVTALATQTCLSILSECDVPELFPALRTWQSQFRAVGLGLNLTQGLLPRWQRCAPSFELALRDHQAWSSRPPVDLSLFFLRFLFFCLGS